MFFHNSAEVLTPWSHTARDGIPLWEPSSIRSGMRYCAFHFKFGPAVKYTNYMFRVAGNTSKQPPSLQPPQPDPSSEMADHKASLTIRW
jgi:hypothetical protein